MFALEATFRGIRNRPVPPGPYRIGLRFLANSQRRRRHETAHPKLDLGDIVQSLARLTPRLSVARSAGAPVASSGSRVVTPCPDHRIDNEQQHDQRGAAADEDGQPRHRPRPRGLLAAPELDPLGPLGLADEHREALVHQLRCRVEHDKAAPNQ